MKVVKMAAVSLTAAAVGAGMWASQAFYTVGRVIDGDTFETTERQLIRINRIDAPELENCGGPEAKAALEKLILNKKLFLKVVYRDKLNRLVGDVYTSRGLVAMQLIKAGYAYYASGGSNPQLDVAANEARQKKLGVHGPACTQTSNIVQPECVIKGNKRFGSSEMLYHFPGCGQYETTVVQLGIGDRWFCTEKEAIKAGFTKGSDCFEMKWK